MSLRCMASARAVSAQSELAEMTSPIDVTAMRDVDDSHDNSILEDRVDHPEFTAPRRVASSKLIAQRLADAVRMLRERTANELPAGDGHGFRKFVGECPLGRPGQFDAVGHRGSRPAARISSVTSSSV